LGKQKKTLFGNGTKNVQFETFSPKIQNIIQYYVKNNGNLLISGAYIGTDLAQNGTQTDKNFLENTLKCKLATANASLCGQVTIIQSPVRQFVKTDFEFYNEPNPNCYFVESPDALVPTAGGYTIARYADSNFSAAIAFTNHNNKICVFAFPLETIKDEKARNAIFDRILDFLK
jgi:hypothetical protein